MNKRILTEAPGAVPKEYGFFMLTREDDCSEEIAALPSGIKAEVAALMERLKGAVPDDFGFNVTLGNDDPWFELVYGDGQETFMNSPVEWNATRSIIDQLKEVDWDTRRKRALQGCQMMDLMREISKVAPPSLPSTKDLQKEFRREMKEFVRTVRTERSEVHVLRWRDDEGLVAERFASVRTFADELPDLMTVQYWIIAVVANGKPLPVRKIDELKTRALKELEDMPISHGKALGKFAGIMG
ncbi:MAG: hypothetical protein KGS61_17605 [Verrucomicrobia bacterium]|nr:hypothetical protein [Verrucomicrobiota bacterium]